MMKFNKSVLSIIMVMVMFLSSVTVSFASSYGPKNSDETGEYTDEQWADYEDMSTEFEAAYDYWDHETWYTSEWESEGWECQEQFVEYVWAVFGSTEWTYGAFPNLNFSSFGIGIYNASNIGVEVQNEIGEYIKSYKFTNGTYSVKNTDSSTGQVTVDNSAYVPLVIACMDVLKSHGTSDDPYAVQQYIIGGTRLSALYKSSNANVDKNVARLVYQRLVSGEKAYNSSHFNKFNIYQKDQGLYMSVQAVVTGSLYAKHKHGSSVCNSYSSGDVSDYYHEKRLDKNNISNFPDFADIVLGGYECGEVENSYVMDAFGHRIE